LRLERCEGRKEGRREERKEERKEERPVQLEGKKYVSRAAKIAHQGQVAVKWSLSDSVHLGLSS
jgi:hypothetical protein